MRRVAVTGLGAITPIGLDATSTWQAAVAGESGIDFIEAFDASEYPVRIAGEVKGFDPASVAPPKEARRMDRNVLLALGAAHEAWREGRSRSRSASVGRTTHPSPHVRPVRTQSVRARS